MNRRWYKIALLSLTLVLLVVASFSQRSLNGERERLGLTRLPPLENAPPLLTFTTVALGGFRGLISNALWMRASTLQEEGKYFEMVQLADWITKLEPHYPQVWRFQAWNMSYNISVKFTSFQDRWRWVQRGISLLRDEGLKYNPHDAQLYHELAWHFYHKMGWNLDEAHHYYKGAWVQEMKAVFGTGEIDIQGLVQPKNEADQARRRLLQEKYKMDPQGVLEVEKEFGPLEWRLPEAHAIYWAAMGLKKAKTADLLPLRRVIYQSRKMQFERGQLTFKDAEKMTFHLGPQLDAFAKVNDSYEKMMKADPDDKEKIKTGHKNFLQEGIQFLYLHNKLKSAGEWFNYLKRLYPAAVPKNQSLDLFVVALFTETREGKAQVQVAALIEAMIFNHYEQLALENDDLSEGWLHTATLIHNNYRQKTKDQARTALTPLPELKKMVLEKVLSPDYPLDQESKAILRARLNLPAPAPKPEQRPNNQR